MSSYILVQIPKEKHDVAEMRKKVGELSIFHNKEELRSGIIPESLEIIEGTLVFDFAFEYDFKYPTLEGEKEVKAIQRVPLIFMESVLALQNCTRDIQNQVLSFIEENLVTDVQLERMKFNEKILRAAVDSSSDLLQVEFSPKRKGLEQIDKLSCLGREITKSEIWDEYSTEPLLSVRINVPDLYEEARVGFKKEGVITIYNRFSLRMNVLTMKLLVENLILQYMSRVFQSKLDGVL